MSFFPPLFQKNFFIPPIMPSFTRPMPLLMVSLVRWNVFSFFIWEVIQSTYSKILRRIYKNSWSFYQEFFKTSYIVFVSCRRSNYLEQPATSRNKPEWARTTSNNLEQAKCQNVNSEEIKPSNWAQAQVQKLLRQKSLSFKILCKIQFCNFSRWQIMSFLYLRHF